MPENIEHSKFCETPTRCQQCTINCHGEDQKINKNKIKQIKLHVNPAAMLFVTNIWFLLARNVTQKLKNK